MADRMVRVNRLIRETLSEMVPRDVADPRVRAVPLVVIREVQTAPDLSHCKVFISVPGDEAAGMKVIVGLQRARGYLRGQLGRRIRLRRTPELHFLLDRTGEAAARLEEILRQLEKERDMSPCSHGTCGCEHERETASAEGAEDVGDSRKAGEGEVAPTGDLRRRVMEVIEEQINPALAMHGGYVELVEVRDTRAFLTMGGGCHGCAASQMTLHSGVEAILLGEIPELTEVIDTTDHTCGENPYMP